ncbi:hypothetical protein ACTI_52400 [Actinoplanes sp. OR16]|uniref:carboxymuconolactone decarboxylase family protein n=1 Tax=Actinoplanes sp. OR16 TaxID=946334 RepID=UPI000F6B31ED|nr:carboxymuconolactone decarboxylase family protein [Actinoplanes sp. OR16]BBH68555.1 hypothetical protein ACTI_52400 [Actinoplanes sp. OR16]
MTRLPGMPPSSLDDAQRALHDAIAGGERANGPFPLVDEDGALVGPFNAMLLQPALGEALQALGSAVRYRTSLSGRAREIAVLTVARVWESDFETYAHRAAGLAAGLSAAELDATRFGDPYEQLVADTTVALAVRGDLTDAEFTAARDGLGEATIFELTTLVGYYATLALQLRVFRVSSPGRTLPS